MPSTPTPLAVTQADAMLARRLHRTLRHTLINRHLCQELRDGGMREVGWLYAQYWQDLRAVVFVVDTGTLPVSLERLADPNVVHQASTALGGRRVEVVNHRGLAFVVGVDVPELERPKPRHVLPRSVTLDLDAVPDGRFMVPMGVGADGPVWHSLTDLDCILVGGVRGGGKTTFLFSLLVSLLTRHGPAELQVAIIDPKGFDFALFNDTPQHWEQRATDADEAVELLQKLIAEMEDRGEQFGRLAVRDIDAFNKAAPEPLPYILLVVDEVTDLVLQAGTRQAADLQRLLIRLISKGRAAGIIVIAATQNPKSEVFSTLARGNFKTRIAFSVPESSMSRTILGQGGAEQLPAIPGRLMALVESVSREPVILQGFYIGDEAVRAILGTLTDQDFNALSELERELVAYAVMQLNGQFNIKKLIAEFQGRIPKAELIAKAQTWEHRGWLSAQKHRADARRVTDELLVRAGLTETESIPDEEGSQDGQTAEPGTRGTRGTRWNSRNSRTRRAQSGQTGGEGVAL